MKPTSAAEEAGPRASLRVVTPYGVDGPSSRVRVHDWLRYTGVHADTTSYLGLPANSPSGLLANASRIPAKEWELRAIAREGSQRILLHRAAAPFSNGRLESKLLRSARHSVYDFDDALMNREMRGFQLLWSEARTARACVAGADRVVAGNEYLADWASQIARDVVVIPSCVDVDDYPPKLDHGISGPAQLVWLGSPSTELVLREMATGLAAALSATGARLTVISSGSAPIPGLDPFVTRVEWHPGIWRQLNQFDIGIMPMTDNPYTRGKCGYKLIQYGAAGLPTIASPVGVNASVSERFGAPAPRLERDWIDVLGDLVRSSASERKAMGSRSRAVVASDFSYRAWADRWRSAVLGSA